MTDFESRQRKLVELIATYKRCVVAFSAGVDSTVVAKAAAEALGDRALAVTAVSPSLASGELDQAVQLADHIGIRHEVIHTGEMQNANYVRNASDRCYHCKSELYDQLEAIAARFEDAVVLSGVNADDAQDYRPGIRAAGEHHVRSPLAECGFTKSDVRQLAMAWELPVWDKPATPCLSSRIAYGETVTPERLAMIDRAEQFLRQQGLREVRVRYHGGDLARLEIPASEISRVADDGFRQTLVKRLRELGFRFVTIDLEGFRSGSLNTLLPIETLRQSARQQA